DGIRDFHVTGVQTCALPISPHQMAVLDYDFWQHFIDNGIDYAARLYSLSYRYRSRRFWTRYYSSEAYDSGNGAGAPNLVLDTVRSEERRVGKEGGECVAAVR